MTPDISEFSYGYALTETLIAAAPLPIRAAPVFPSLIREGQPGGGYDVQIPFSGFPLFLQFKLSDKMVRHSAKEAQDGHLTIPFFRMHLRPTNHSQQHPMLHELESSGVSVYYAAPLFHTPAELNDAYINSTVIPRSAFFRPSEIGDLPDGGNHHLSFKEGYPVYLFSDAPTVIRENTDWSDMFFRELSDGLNRFDKISPEDESVRAWIERLIKIVERNRGHFGWYSSATASALRSRHPANALVYLARTFFGCNIIVVSRRTLEAGDYEPPRLQSN